MAARVARVAVKARAEYDTKDGAEHGAEEGVAPGATASAAVEPLLVSLFYY